MAWPSFMEFYAQLPPDRIEALIMNLDGAEPHVPGEVPTADKDLSMVHTALSIAMHLLREYHEWLGKALESP